MPLRRTSRRRSQGDSNCSSNDGPEFEEGEAPPHWAPHRALSLDVLLEKELNKGWFADASYVMLVVCLRRSGPDAARAGVQSLNETYGIFAALALAVAAMETYTDPGQCRNVKEQMITAGVSQEILSLPAVLTRISVLRLSPCERLTWFDCPR
eukprot:TRINITY_DN8800_c2_g1_i1.p1 TRINITY_DN8800_c2_g1~~TRINITY_DN8800_c2_g1_i1.p1  ORF type:complete len:153 (-),score=6.81 TRINITY_DN8800_c2_g1_i1:99-557(-)